MRAIDDNPAVVAVVAGPPTDVPRADASSSVAPPLDDHAWRRQMVVPFQSQEDVLVAQPQPVVHDVWWAARRSTGAVAQPVRQEVARGGHLLRKHHVVVSQTLREFRLSVVVEGVHCGGHVSTTEAEDEK